MEQLRPFIPDGTPKHYIPLSEERPSEDNPQPFKDTLDHNLPLLVYARNYNILSVVTGGNWAPYQFYLFEDESNKDDIHYTN